MAIDFTGSRIVLTCNGTVSPHRYSDGTALRTIYADVIVYWANSTDIDMNIRVFCSDSSDVSSSNYIAYEDYPLGDYDYYIVNDDSNGAAFYDIMFTGLDPKKDYYFKAYALTGVDYEVAEIGIEEPEYEELLVNADFCSETKPVSAIAPLGKWVNNPAVNVLQGSNNVAISATLGKGNMYGVSCQYKIVVFNVLKRVQQSPAGISVGYIEYLPQARELYGDKIVYESNSTTLTTNGDRISLSTTINNIPAGEYYCYFLIYYYDQYNSGEWVCGSIINANGDGYYYSGNTGLWHEYEIIGTNLIPTASWGTPMSVSQTPGAKTANYSASLTRTDSLQDPFYIRIRIIDISDSEYVATGSAMQVANSGSTTFTGTTTRTYNAGTYSFQFVAEWRSGTSDSWSQLMTASGDQLKKTVTFVVNESGSGSGQSEISGMLPLWSWSKQNNAHATEQQVRQAYIAITSQGMPSYFPYQVWNSLLYFVRTCIEQFGKTWWGSEKGEKYLNFQHALMTESDKVLTEKRFMTLTYNILNISASSGVSFSKPYYSVEREPGEIVYGAYFISATNAINDVITQINILSQS